eukprot:4756764-Amphidinium_carterae.1
MEKHLVSRATPQSRDHPILCPKSVKVPFFETTTLPTKRLRPFQFSTFRVGTCDWRRVTSGASHGMEPCSVPVMVACALREQPKSASFTR